MYVCGMPSGLQSVPNVVRPRTSFGPRTITNFSAPGFSGGAFAPAGSPAKLYTPGQIRFAVGHAETLRCCICASRYRFGHGRTPTVTVTVLDGPPRSDNV